MGMLCLMKQAVRRACEEESWWPCRSASRKASSTRLIKTPGFFRSMESSKFADDFAGSIGPAGAGQAVAGVRPGTTKEESANGRFVARPI